MTVTELPRTPAGPPPSPTRWRPSRAGLLNVWRYFDEVFTFSGGRLLLRGANGTGKSKALELLLPFVLDASLHARRLSTFGTGERTMHWNLMGEGATGTTRVGYVWVEFTDGTRWFTCGARLQATSHRTEVGADYFSTTRRVGHDLSLTTDAGTPLTRPQLDEALGGTDGAGGRHDNAGDYRTTVRQTLFPGMSETRYEALITALLQLRTPKLSQRLDPSVLSTLLSQALPPLGENEVTDLAEGFERLDRHRERLARLDDEVAAAKEIAGRQRGYARRVLRAAAAGLISATTEMDEATRTARLSEQEHGTAATERDRVEAALAELAERGTTAENRLDALRDLPAYREGTALDDLRVQLRAAAGAATTARAQADRARELADRDREQVEQARRRSATVDGLRETRRTEAHTAARQAGLGTAMTSLEDAIADGAGPPGRADPARGRLRAAVESRQHQIADVRRHLDAWSRAVDRRTGVETDLDQARARLADATAARGAASDRYDTALAGQADRLERWATAARELTGLDVDALVAAAESEAGVLAVAGPAERAARRALDLDEDGRTARRTELAAERSRVREERDRIAAQRDVPPPAPDTRTAERTERPGAPLWRLVGFADGVGPRQQAAVEAALQASGLLDAWVAPSGALRVDGHDTFAGAADPAPGRSLLDVVVPEQVPDAPVDAETVRGLLRSIAFGDDRDAHSAVITPDGRFRLAALTGSWSKPRAAHIGAAAREQARTRRLAELDDEIDGLDDEIAEVHAALATVVRRRTVLDAECAARPDHRDLDAARDALTRADAALAEADSTVGRTLERRTAAEAAVAAAVRELSVQAAEHGLPAEPDALDALDRAVTVFGRLGDVWIGSVAEARHTRELADRADEQARRSDEAHTGRDADAGVAEAEARRLQDRVTSIEDAIGSEYREIMAQIAAVRQERDTVARAEKETHETLRGLERRIGELEAVRLRDVQRRDDSAGARNTAAGTFRARCLLGLPGDAGIDLAVEADDGTRTTLENARRVAATWPSVPYTTAGIAQAFGQLSESLHRTRDALAERADLALEPEEDVHVFRAVVDGRPVGAAALLERVDADAERSRADITAAERELFDTTLTGETRRHLAARMREADTLVTSMNDRLSGVRTASRVAVRLRWKVADDVSAGTRAARDLLLRDPVRLSDEDRASLHRFFRDRIDAARADGVAGNWEQQLTEVFDYTRWHQFVVEIDRADGRGWQQLTRKLHGALSGGEKAIALHLPLFAAVAAYYVSVPEAPRLILLDEVFVGVDALNRGQVFALLSALDLDLVLTSDHEWCTYRELDDIAIHQLITGTDDDAVTTARFVWNGHELQDDP